MSVEALQTFSIALSVMSIGLSIAVIVTAAKRR